MIYALGEIQRQLAVAVAGVEMNSNKVDSLPQHSDLHDQKLPRGCLKIAECSDEQKIGPDYHHLR